MAKLTITYTPAEFPIAYVDGFDGVTIPAVFVGQNAYIDSTYVDGEDVEHLYDKTSYDTNNYGLGINWDDTFDYFKALSAHPGIVAAMKAAYEDAIAKSEAAGEATEGSADFDVTGVAGPVVDYYKRAIAEAGYGVSEAAEDGGEG